MMATSHVAMNSVIQSANPSMFLFSSDKMTLTVPPLLVIYFRSVMTQIGKRFISFTFENVLEQCYVIVAQKRNCEQGQCTTFKKVIYLVAVTPHTVEQKIRVATSVEALIPIILKLGHVLLSNEMVCTVRPE